MKVFSALPMATSEHEAAMKKVRSRVFLVPMSMEYLINQRPS